MHGTYKGSSSNLLFHKETDLNPSQARALSSADLYHFTLGALIHAELS
jgi:hypothetical protein